MWEVDTYSEWLEGISDFVCDLSADSIVLPWMEFTPIQIAERNASIREAWASPIRRAKQSATLRITHSNPAVRAKISAAKTAYWKAWRAARVTDSEQIGTTEVARETPNPEV